MTTIQSTPSSGPARLRYPASEPQPPRRRRRRAPGAGLWKASPLTYLTLVAAIILSIFPIYVMIIGATTSKGAINSVPPPLLPSSHFMENLRTVWANPSANIGKGLANSIIVASAITVSTVFFSTLAGFAFAKLRFKGKNALLLLVLGSSMVPVQLGVIPLYLMMVKFGWRNHLAAVIIPFLITAFGIFMMRQYASQAVPDELVEAARIDGCSTWRIYLSVVLPALRPAASVLAIFTFLQTWNDFLWPLVALQDPENPTVQLSLRRLGTGYYTDYAQVFAGTSLAVLPLLVVFIIFGRQIIGGIMEGALKA
ncbi:MAG TPA: carbohydrate ABC transporter permease [Rugosimonospora sp.]|nr:carbohydrate ABC transporter permease [Rugosimonospora sp.]